MSGKGGVCCGTRGLDARVVFPGTRDVDGVGGGGGGAGGLGGSTGSVAGGLVSGTGRSTSVSHQTIHEKRRLKAPTDGMSMLDPFLSGPKTESRVIFASSPSQCWKNAYGRTESNGSRNFWRQAFELFLEVLCLIRLHGGLRF
jgi:hypothetical protein